ncbi:MAG: nucleotidyl transferase AbiEii/AbiGii toxin family protein, partial [Tetragenococcus koreensis]|nr:nucleotidyl transferase AbiEii/AbiGii toxin family protein [Tetragenococcus koreensis]
MLSEQKMKNLIDKKARETDLPKQQLYGLYALEQLLVKLNDSSYKDKLILKGGYLLATVYGLNNRVTRDLDITVRDTYLTEEMLINIADFVSTTDKNGEVHFELRGIRKTREEFDYNGYELKLLYKNGRTKFPISVDFTTGENLISIEEENSLPLMFEEEKKLNFPSYTIEQILTDKFYTIIAYGKYDDTNSRMKDYYDIYLLSTIGKNIDYYAINNGLSRIMKQR